MVSGSSPGTHSVPAGFRSGIILANRKGSRFGRRLMQQMLDTTDDSSLAGAAIRGDREAFRRLVERHYNMIYRVAYRYAGSEADAKDIAQDVCITLATKLSHFRGKSQFSTWLYRIVINRCRDFSRQRRSSAALVVKYGAYREAEDGDQADSEKRLNWLHASLQSLEPGLRETMLLILGEDLTHAEAAKVLGCAESTVSWRVHMAKKQLKARLDSDDD